MRPKVAPLPRRQLPKLDVSNTYALEAHDLKADLLAHAANLALFPFGQDKAKLLWVLPFHLGTFERFAIQAQAVA